MSATANQARAGVLSRAQIPMSISEARKPCAWVRVLGALTDAVNAAFWITNAAERIPSAGPYRLGKLVATNHRSDAMPRRSTQGAAGTR